MGCGTSPGRGRGWKPLPAPVPMTAGWNAGANTLCGPSALSSTAESNDERAGAGRAEVGVPEVDLDEPRRYSLGIGSSGLECGDEPAL